MLTLDNLLSENRPPSSDEAYVLHAIACSPFMARLLRKDAALLQNLLQNLHQPYHLGDMQRFLSQQNIVDEFSLKQALRVLRRHVMARVIIRDLNGLADLHEVVQTTSQLAECAITVAIRYLNTWLVSKCGQPVDTKGCPQNLIVIGMGKLGGYELNVSSDIDLIFAYEAEGETQGDKSISNQDFFTRLAKKLIAAIDEITEDGFVFRVDMRLRPFGSEGVLVCNLDTLEYYYQNNGREWERYAWIKGREITGGSEVSRLLRPFVFRKYLDFGALESMRDLKIQIQRDVNSKGMHDNIKLGRGGIREIEFIAQVFQLIRGGQDVSLQIKPTLSVLALLKNKGLLPEKTVAELSEAYEFLRNLEHRLMYVDDAQTQELPRTEEAKLRIAKAMNFVSWPEFIANLDAYRAQVQRHFDATFNEADAGEDALASEKAIWDGALAEVDAISGLQALGFTDAHETLRRLDTLHQSNRYLQLPELSRHRFDAVMPHVISQSAKMQNADTTLTRVTDLLENICRRASYLALLAEHPQAMQLLVKLCSSSPWLANYLAQHPILLDELLDTRTLYAAPDFVAMRLELIGRLSEIAGDVERQMDVMRHFKHANIFRFAAQDINGELVLETISDYLSDLADLILSVALEFIWPNVRGKHLDKPKFAVIGYGKLGGKELGYASDLDIIFLHDDDAPEAGEVYARFAQRINNWFNSLTSAGLLYETDLQLRPDGNSGLLVSSVAAFREYQLNKAWVWEHQAITRARFVTGDSHIGKAFDDIRVEVMTQPRDAEKLKTEVLSMREKMREAQHSKGTLFDIKHGVGGIIDVEFLVQYLVLLHAKNNPCLTGNIGNIGLLKLLGSLEIIDANLATQVSVAYREYRHRQHMLKLQGATKLGVELAPIAHHVEVVKLLWNSVFEIG
ncbi:MAG: bifunctional [glutamate--ammonia ligase]-adenylyl-L-tyrosine phosphorylase/[glutamate--ammonia-ligase] adenylyltransferase [Methylotenera sp.]|nr:bifunctional [glutamate--ammonia ligase]-adenylyl-L-tyrosine phosphorylase/[glutamate--ammonia-ligase] adenylyltransferase [Methylotenera sp.]MDP1754421.1 bifunctional [glutamate--ammonia ligase]-adenylyl-L-tyrosine phosphorylase/[glutamate--ammonia-ligase] adenylyltransferase [Methylotenera sp.]MDP1958581.1 bifunctional [glutamate--ammonia ligase]-adenylyl-L-tyrosine phosphorylase/[glutamate--ammonia-ligase] adenylyltransferase [Methylotenera sp.]MDP3302889.1 bifunctional [glutamate--ammonia